MLRGTGENSVGCKEKGLWGLRHSGDKSVQGAVRKQGRTQWDVREILGSDEAWGTKGQG